MDPKYNIFYIDDPGPLQIVRILTFKSYYTWWKTDRDQLDLNTKGAFLVSSKDQNDLDII